MVGQYGHEDSTAAYVTTLRDVFREARRVPAEPGYRVAEVVEELGREPPGPASTGAWG